MNQYMEELPGDVIIDILSRLPVKTIIHCKCVCKTWRNLLSDSHFINLHLSRSSQGLMIFQKMPNHSISDILKWIQIEDELDHHNLHIDPFMNFDLNIFAPHPESYMFPVGSANGLICISQHSYSDDHHNIYICNPTTREYMVAPMRVVGVGACSFGVSSYTGEYKVLQIVNGDYPNEPYYRRPEACVYTVGTGEWRNIGYIPFSIVQFTKAYLNGRFHYLILNRDASEKICTFDVEDETFQLFPSPPTESAIDRNILAFYPTLGVLKGCLCQCNTYEYDFAIWVMKEYGIKESWHKELVIDRGVDPDLGWPMSWPIYVVKGFKDGNILMSRGKRGKPFVYCPQSKRLEHLEIYVGWFRVMEYCPSFLKLESFESEKVNTLPFERLHI